MLQLANSHQRIDEAFMDVALQAARRAGADGEVPIGAAVVMGESDVVAVAGNAPIATNDPTAHAEILALRHAARLLGNYRLVGASVYVTVEPCIMCVGALLQARVAKVVYGCAEPKAGALGSLYNIGSDSRVNHHMQIRGGVCEAQARELLQMFFRERRGA